MSNISRIMGMNKHYSNWRLLTKKFPNRKFKYFQFMQSDKNNHHKNGIYDTTNFKDTSAEWEQSSKPNKELFIAATLQAACDLLLT